jgi:hypothetical protein
VSAATRHGVASTSYSTRCQEPCMSTPSPSCPHGIRGSYIVHPPPYRFILTIPTSGGIPPINPQGSLSASAHLPGPGPHPWQVPVTPLPRPRVPAFHLGHAQRRVFSLLQPLGLPVPALSWHRWRVRYCCCSIPTLSSVTLHIVASLIGVVTARCEGTYHASGMSRRRFPVCLYCLHCFVTRDGV